MIKRSPRRYNKKERNQEIYMKNKIGQAKSYEEEYWWCDRCEIDDTGDRMCPCPRGYCEAEPIGKIIITKIYVPNKEE